MTADRDPAADRWPWLFDKFRAHYLPGKLRKNFHAVRLARSGATPPADGPLVVVVNHPGWWDPLIAAVTTTRFDPRLEHFGAMDADALKVYRVFRPLGFVGVDTKTIRGAAEFLRTGERLLSVPHRAYWVPAQGTFADVRRRPLGLRSGVGHLAARLAGGFVVPVGFEYLFWDEARPEALVRIGEPLPIRQGTGGKEWTARIEAALTATLDALSADAMSRDPGRFDTLVGGRAGAGGVYDLVRRAKALVTGRRFVAGHTDAVREARG
jgi:1-acyl-sn-glycerol-3-phosphate acyltransferase